MSTQLPSNNPTGYLGLRETYVGQVWFRDDDPVDTQDFRIYRAGDRWINQKANTVWTLVKKTITSGTWVDNTSTSNIDQWVQAPISTTMVPVTSYYITGGALVVLTLPVVCPAGVLIRIQGFGFGGWRIAQNANQRIFINNIAATTLGILGTLSSTDRCDGIELLCVVANQVWVATHIKGNLLPT